MMRKRSATWMPLILSMVLVSGCALQPQVPAAPTDQNVPAVSSPASSEDKTVKTGPFKGMLAPDFILKDMSGTEWTLSSLKGSSVALIFFTSW